MARSLKKGPFADASLHGHAVLQSSRHLLVIHLPYMTEEDMCLYMLQRTWLATNSVSSLQQELTEDTAKTRRNQKLDNFHTV